jgi:glycosyltransferase involved in cell wall biosynthesis
LNLAAAPGSRINLMIAAAGLGIGGAEVVIQRLAQSIDRSRFNLTICCLKNLGPIGDALIAEGFDVVVLSDPEQPKPGYLTFFKLWQLIRARRIDVIHTHTTDALFDAGFCRFLMRRLRLVHTFHFGNYPHRSASRMWMEKTGARFADRIVAVGDVQRRQVMDAYRFGEERVQRIWNGVAVPPPRGVAEFRRSIGADNRVLVGVTATMIEQKGLFDFLAVAARFRDEADRVRFVVVGEGRLRERLDAAKRDLGVEGNVVFAGWVPHAAEVALPAFDIFFQPSLWEAMSIALLEAMAASKAVVATDVGEAPFIVEDGVDGLLVKPKDVDGMTAALRRLIDDAALRERMGTAAARKVNERFTVERMTRTYEQLYLDMLQGRASIR